MARPQFDPSAVDLSDLEAQMIEAMTTSLTDEPTPSCIAGYLGER